MEGSADKEVKRVQWVAGGLIVLFHSVGLYGFTDPDLIGTFKRIVPFHLLLMLAILLYTGYDGSRAFVWFAGVIFLAGFLVEVAGVNTGKIFGEYQYGPTLGLKLWNTPLMIGVNWFMLVYSAGISVYYLTGPSKPFLSALLGTIILVALDFLIEPVAVHFDYWSWRGGLIPFQNYVAWFITAFLMLQIFATLKFRKQNLAAVVLLLTQVVFFGVLNAAIS